MSRFTDVLICAPTGQAHVHVSGIVVSAVVTYVSFPGNALRVKVLDGPMLLENEVSCAHGQPSYQGHGPPSAVGP